MRRSFCPEECDMHLPVSLLPVSFLLAACAGLLSACAGPTRGPDKQFAGGLEGAATSAGAGAIYGAQVGAGSGVGVAVGAGIGAVAGSIQGFAQDQLEEDLLDLNEQTRVERDRAMAQRIIAENYQRRLEIHPTREIYPADLFFSSDNVTLTELGRMLVRELARMNTERLPWSRFAVASYVRSSDKESTFAHYLAEKRAIAIGDALVREGFDPRRVIARGVVMEGPLLLDPRDAPERYNQAIEFIPLDR